MARLTDQFRQSDLALWGIVALVAGGVALFSANVSALAPDSFFTALHTSRAADRSADDLRSKMADLGKTRGDLAAALTAQQALHRENADLAARLDDLTRNTGAVGERVSALEGALPHLVKTLPLDANTDSSLITGGIGSPHSGFSVEMAAPARGSSVKVARLHAAIPAPSANATGPAQPLPNDLVATTAAEDAALSAVPPVPSAATASIAALPHAANAASWLAIPAAGPVAAPNTASPPASPIADIVPLPLPDARSASANPAGTTTVPHTPVPLAEIHTAATAPAATPATPDVKAIGVALGTPVQPAGALAAWQALAARVGVLLVGTSPLLADDPAGSGGKVLVAGPLDSIAAATKLCADIGHANVGCTPMPYVGMGLTAAP